MENEMAYQQPDRTKKVDEVSKGKPTGKKLREYQYTNSKGKKISVRKDNATKYHEGGQGIKENTIMPGIRGTN